jgi:hypothetical protein
VSRAHRQGTCFCFEDLEAKTGSSRFVKTTACSTWTANLLLTRTPSCCLSAFCNGVRKPRRPRHLNSGRFCERHVCLGWATPSRQTPSAMIFTLHARNTANDTNADAMSTLSNEANFIQSSAFNRERQKEGSSLCSSHMPGLINSASYPHPLCAGHSGVPIHLDKHVGQRRGEKRRPDKPHDTQPIVLSIPPPASTVEAKARPARLGA